MKPNPANQGKVRQVLLDTLEPIVKDVRAANNKGSNPDYWKMIIDQATDKLQALIAIAEIEGAIQGYADCGLKKGNGNGVREYAKNMAERLSNLKDSNE